MSQTARRLPDIACESMGCLGLNDQACRGEFVISVYQFSPLQLQDCEGTTFFTPFKLNAVFLDAPTTSVPITMTSLVVHNNPWGSSTDAGTLSVRPFHLRSFLWDVDLTNIFSLGTVQVVPIRSCSNWIYLLNRS